MVSVMATRANSMFLLRDGIPILIGCRVVYSKLVFDSRSSMNAVFAS